MHRIPTLAAIAAIAIPIAASAQAAEVILYDFTNFQGRSITLTQAAPDLDAFGFDNDVESIRVISGTWSFHRDDNFQNGNGPAITLGPGDYADIAALGFPGDRMSSVLLVQDDILQCGEGTVPGPQGQQCVCAQGLAPIGADDQGRLLCGPQVVAPQPLPQSHWIELAGLAIDGRAYETADRDVLLSTDVTTSPSLQGVQLDYRAAEGPLVRDEPGQRQILSGAPWQTYRIAGAFRPNRVQFQLSQGNGERYIYFQVRARVTDASGGFDFVTSEIHVDSIVLRGVPDVRYVPAGQAFGVADANGFGFTADNGGSEGINCFLQRNGDALELMAEDNPSSRLPGILPNPGLQCVFRLFADRDLASGWSYAGRIDVEPGVCGAGQVFVYTEQAGTLSPGERGIVIQIIPDLTYSPGGLRNCLLHGWTLRGVGLVGPPGVDPMQAFR